MQIDVKPRSTCAGIVASASSRSATEPGVGEAAARAADELELVEFAACLGQRVAQARDVVVGRPAERVPAVAVAHEPAEQPVVERARPEPQPDAVVAKRLRLDPDVLEAVEAPGEGGRRLAPRRVPRREVLVEERAALRERHTERLVLGCCAS